MNPPSDGSYLNLPNGWIVILRWSVGYHCSGDGKDVELSAVDPHGAFYRWPDTLIGVTNTRLTSSRGYVKWALVGAFIQEIADIPIDRGVY
jgi:hypothetical protein